MVDIRADSELRRSPSALGADVGDLHVLLSDELRYLGLDAVGRRTWELLERPRTLDDLVAALTAEYRVGEAECRADVTRFVESLTEHGLVTVT